MEVEQSCHGVSKTCANSTNQPAAHWWQKLFFFLHFFRRFDAIAPGGGAAGAEQPLIGRSPDGSGGGEGAGRVGVRECVAAPPTGNKSRATRKLLPLRLKQRLEVTPTMTVHTQPEQPALTYSKSKGLVTLVSGTESSIQTVFFFFGGALG